MPQLFVKIAKNRASLLLFVVFAGIAYGFLIRRFFLRLPATYATFLSVGMISPLVAIIVGDTKRLLWAGLIICLPITVDITLYRTYASGTEGFVISLYDMILICLYLFWFTEIVKKKQARLHFHPKLSLPALLLIGIAGMSAFRAPLPNLCLYEIVEIIKMYLTFLYFANNIRSNDDAKFVFLFLILGLSFEGFLGFAQHRYGQPFFPSALGGPSSIDQRVMGTWQSYNDFAWYLTCILPIALSMLFSDTNLLFKLLCGFASFFGFGALMWTNSRSGWISFGVAALFVSFFVFRKIKSKRSLINIFFTLIAIAIFMSPLYPRLYNKMYGRFAMDDGGAAQSRWPQFRIALNMIVDHPILGVGINNYARVMYSYDETDKGLWNITYKAVHNIFLLIAAEIGIFGLAAFLWLILIIFLEGLKYIRWNQGFSAYGIIGVLAGISAFLVHGLYDVAPLGRKLYMFVWFFAGLIFGITKLTSVSVSSNSFTNNG